MTWVALNSMRSVSEIDDRMRKDTIVTPTGMPSIDSNFYLWGDRKGIPQGSYVLVGGASNVGKTLFGLSMARQAAMTGQKAGIVSLDMKNRDVTARMLQASVPEIGFRDWRPSKWQDEYRTKLIAGLERMNRDMPGSVHIHAERGRDLHLVEDRIREGAEKGFTFFVVDHLQKIRVSNLRGDVFSTADVVSETMDDLVDELDVTIVGLSQLNRNASRETDRSPTMFDLHGGTSMESNALIVFMLDHSLVEMDRHKHHLIRTFLKLEKNQIGPKNMAVPILIDAANLSFTEGLPHEEHLWPSRTKKR